MTCMNLSQIPNAKAVSTLALIAACALVSFAARADTAPARPAIPTSVSHFGFHNVSLDVDTDLDADLQQGPDDDSPFPPPPPPNWRPRRREQQQRPYYQQREARTGAIFGFGFGGAQQYVSGAGHSGGFDTNLRLGYGFSDRFQLLFDVGGSDTPSDSSFQSISMWHFRVHGQTVLAGDRRGNGLNLNFGVGFGGVTTDGFSTVHDSSQVGVSVGAGISYEGRVSQHFALAPELFASWQQVPNGYNLPSDIAWTLGARLNFIWYSPF
jgi:hypothetical protein